MWHSGQTPGQAPWEITPTNQCHNAPTAKASSLVLGSSVEPKKVSTSFIVHTSDNNSLSIYDDETNNKNKTNSIKSVGMMMTGPSSSLLVPHNTTSSTSIAVGANTPISVAQVSNNGNNDDDLSDGRLAQATKTCSEIYTPETARQISDQLHSLQAIMHHPDCPMQVAISMIEQLVTSCKPHHVPQVAYEILLAMCADCPSSSLTSQTASHAQTALVDMIHAGHVPQPIHFAQVIRVFSRTANLTTDIPERLVSVLQTMMVHAIAISEYCENTALKILAYSRRPNSPELCESVFRLIHFHEEIKKKILLNELLPILADVKVDVSRIRDLFPQPTDACHNNTAWNILLHSWGRSRRFDAFEQCISVLNDMKTANVMIDIVSMNTLLLCAITTPYFVRVASSLIKSMDGRLYSNQSTLRVRTGQDRIFLSYEILNIMREHRIVPNSRSYSLVVKACAESDMMDGVERADEVLLHMAANRIEPNEVTLATCLKAQAASPMVGAHRVDKGFELMSRILTNFCKCRDCVAKSTSPDSRVCESSANCLIGCEEDDDDSAWADNKATTQPSAFAITSLFKVIGRCHDYDQQTKIDKAYQVLGIMVEHHFHEVNSHSWHQLIRCCGGSSHAGMAFRMCNEAGITVNRSGVDEGGDDSRSMNNITKATSSSRSSNSSTTTGSKSSSYSSREPRETTSSSNTSGSSKKKNYDVANNDDDKSSYTYVHHGHTARKSEAVNHATSSSRTGRDGSKTMSNTTATNNKKMTTTAASKPVISPTSSSPVVKPSPPTSLLMSVFSDMTSSSSSSSGSTAKTQEETTATSWKIKQYDDDDDTTSLSDSFTGGEGTEDVTSIALGTNLGTGWTFVHRV